MVTVETIKKSWKNAVLAKHAANDWLIYERSGKHSTNLKGFSLLSQNIDKLKCFKSVWIEDSTNFTW